MTTMTTMIWPDDTAGCTGLLQGGSQGEAGAPGQLQGDPLLPQDQAQVRRWAILYLHYIVLSTEQYCRTPDYGDHGAGHAAAANNVHLYPTLPMA